MAAPRPGEMVPRIQVGLLGKICSKNLTQGMGQVPCAIWKGTGSFKAMRRFLGNCRFCLGFSVIMQILRKEP